MKPNIFLWGTFTVREEEKAETSVFSVFFLLVLLSFFFLAGLLYRGNSEEGGE